MTPELRSKLYEWAYEADRHGAPEDCNPLQLQLLFARLHLSYSTLRTTGLTKSFGWNEHESFQQHDAQEFCRVVFDAIESSVSGTSLSNMIRDLFQSQLTNYVKCLTCLQESCTVDFYLDWSLTIRNPFEGIMHWVS
jgi:ubiquitin carboxyl-terminal hydrolase 47